MGRPVRRGRKPCGTMALKLPPLLTGSNASRTRCAARKPESSCSGNRFSTRFSPVQGRLPLGHRLYFGLHGLKSDPVSGRSPHSIEQLTHSRSLRHGLQACVLQRMEQAQQGRGLRRHRAKKPGALRIGHQQRREGFDIDVADQLSLVFHIEPDKPEGWMALGQLPEDGLIVTANAAPGSAKADDPGRPRGGKRLGGGYIRHAADRVGIRQKTGKIAMLFYS